MARFNGTPVDETAPATGPRFKGMPVDPQTGASLPAPAAPAPAPTEPETVTYFDPIQGPITITKAQDQAANAPGQPGAVESFMRGGTQGATFGAGDEIYAGLEAGRGQVMRDRGQGPNLSDLVTGNASQFPTYDQALADARSGNKAAETAHPWAYNTGKIAGNVAALVPAGATAIGGRVLGASGSLLSRMLMGGTSGAVLGGAQSFAEGEGDVQDRLQNVGWGAGFGALGGVAAPVVGTAAGAATRWAGDAIGSLRNSIPGTGRAAGRMLTNDIEVTGLPQVQGRLNELGPDAFLLDGSPALQSRAQGLATERGAPGAHDTLVNALTTRDEGTNARLGQSLNENFGPAPVPSQVEAQFAAKRVAAGPKYDASLAGAGPVDASDVLTYIGQRLNTAEGSDRAALLRARDMLMQEDASGNLVPKTSAERLHNVKSELGKIIDYGDPTIGVPRGAMSGEDSALNAVRGRLNRALEEQVPGYAEANQQYRTAARASAALESGKRVLDGGENAIHPQDFAQDFSGRPMEQQAALRAGVRADIDRTLGTTTYDLSALDRLAQTPGDWNFQKLSEVFGPDEATRVLNARDREKAFRQAYQDILRGTQTAQRTAAAKGVEVRGLAPSSSNVGTSIVGAVGGPKAVAVSTGIKAVNAGGRALQRASDIARNEQLARVLALPQGGERDLVMQAVGNRIGSREAGRQAAPYVDRLAQALLSAEGIQAEPQIQYANPKLLARSLMGR